MDHKNNMGPCCRRVLNALFFLFLTCSNFHLYSQTNECIDIDFESILGATPSDGQSINSQFQDSFGLSFSLETGGFPVIAQVGGSQTAFSSSYGPDTPAPGQNIGSYFLTDDGVLAGLISPAIILDFESPIDSFGGCILDIDFGELFIIHARDFNEEIVLIDTILPTDPNTGDGLSTCWSFDLGKCEGPVYSIRLQGRRQESGAFGMGLDNLVFCLSDSDLANEIEIESTIVTCAGELGTIGIQNLGDDDLIYSIDGINFQTDPNFANLDVGLYTISVQEANGCRTDFENIRIEEETIALSTQVNATNTLCNLNNGSISISTSVEDDLIYFFEGVSFQGDSIFTNLPSGDYSVFVSDARGCTDIQIASILPSEEISLDIVALPDWCMNNKGEIIVNATGGNGNFQYKMDNSEAQTDFIFSDLSSGTFTIQVEDSDACITTQQVFVDEGEAIVISDIQANDPDCNNLAGSIILDVDGGNSALSYSLNGANPTLNPSFLNLDPDEFSIIISDNMGCQDSLSTRLELPICPIYIPNSFSPTSNGINDLFQIYTNSVYDVDVLQYAIYDRWGEEIWVTSDFTIHTADRSDYWDGTFRGKDCMQGVYVYTIEVRHLNGSVEMYAGDVTLVR